MSKKSRQERKAAKAALDQASQDAAAINAMSFISTSATLEEANTKLADASRVINMKEAKARSAARQSKTVKGEAKGQRKAAGGGLGKLPALPKVAGRKRERPVRPCECGCGGETKSRFCPGHDSHLRGLVLRVYREIMTLDEVEKMAGGAIGKAMRAAVVAEMAAMKKAGKLVKVIPSAPKAVKEKMAKVQAAESKTEEHKEGVAG